MKRLLAAAPGFVLLILPLLGFASGGTGTPATPTDYCLDSYNNNLCPDSIHNKHQSVMNDCQGCHNLTASFNVSATFFKDSSKRAFIAGGHAPVYTPSGNWSSPQTAAAATCSNIACHSTATGTYSYYVYDWGNDDYDLVTVNYGGTSTATASWQDNSVTNCNSCHGNPPRDGNVWHSGSHGNGMPGGNNCELCHPDAKSNLVNGQIVSNFITVPSEHQDGTVTVLAKYESKCFLCH
jgi:predicted CxxxxCH...CXXCH cytochrome family protein